MRRIVIALLSCLLAVAWLVVGAPAAQAAGAPITRMEIQARIGSDGLIQVTQTFDMRFSGSNDHGPYVFFTTRYEVPNDSSRWRVLRYTISQVSSPTGAPAQWKTEHRSGTLALRIGSPNRTVHGSHTYVVEYTGLQGRWQKVRSTPTVICDTGHNVGGWEYLSRQLQDVSCLGVKRIVFGMVDDKDIDGVMRMLPHDAVYYFTKASSHRAISEYKVREKGMTYGLKGRCFPSVSEAYRQALADAVSTDFIFVGGSSYIVSDFFAARRRRLDNEIAFPSRLPYQIFHDEFRHRRAADVSVTDK